MKPSVDTLRAGVDDMRPWADDSAVLKPDPGRAKGQAYPLTVVSYAAASVDQAPKDRKAYADFMRYAAGPGQTQGRAAGQLPPGYAPLPEKLRMQAEVAADDLEKGGSGSDPSSDGPNAQGSGEPPQEQAPVGPRPARAAGEGRRVERPQGGVAGAKPARRRRKQSLRTARPLLRRGRSRISPKPGKESHRERFSASFDGSFSACFLWLERQDLQVRQCFTMRNAGIPRRHLRSLPVTFPSQGIGWPPCTILEM